jgi:hypothetical protein
LEGTELAKRVNDKVNIERKVFHGKNSNTELPELLRASNFYISMPITEGVSTSLFEAMASNSLPHCNEHRWK